MPTTYTKIASTTLSSTSSSVTFSSIPQTFTDLVLVLDFVGSTTFLNTQTYFNNDTTNGNYSVQYLFGQSAEPRAARESRPNIGGNWSSSSYPLASRGQGVMNIFNYSSTTYKKTVVSRYGSDLETGLNTGTWLSTSAITSITVESGNAGVFIGSSSVFTLYGILAA